MRMYDLIYKKREGEKLEQSEIDYIIAGYTRDEIPDYQMSAWAMAVYFQGMDAEETAHLTRAVVNSGETVDLSSLPGKKVDKHSTGGVGDTTSLVLVPLVAAAGVPVPKMSGRGLGHTGGTLDKLESIPGLQTDLNRQDFLQQVQEIGAAVVGQTANLTPADKRLYSLRDVTATVDSIPLIASSIMGKKIAGGSDSIVLDVKMGSGAFMQELDQARELSRLMVDIGENLGRNTKALLTDMSQPLGRCVGNSLEVKEAINTLAGNGPADLEELCIKLGAAMLVAGDYSENMEAASDRLNQLLESGKAREKFARLVEAQAGDPAVIEDPSLLPSADNTREITAETSGYVSETRARNIGIAAMQLGAGRETKEDNVDPGAGIELSAKRGEQVQAGDTMAVLHYDRDKNLTSAVNLVKDAYKVKDQPPEPRDLIIDSIG